MNNQQRPDNKFYWLKLKKQLSKAGKTFYTGNFAYAVDIVGFEKEDGTINLFLAPKDMDQMKQKGQGQQQQFQPQPQGSRVQQFDNTVRQQQQQPPQQKQPFVDHTKPNYPEPPKGMWGPDDDDSIPF